MNTRPNYIKSVEQDRPRTIYFYATSHCNSNCAYCAFRTSNKEMPRMHLPLVDIRRIWLQSNILRTCGVVVQGGEFTVHPEAEDIMRFFHTFIPKVTLLTNAVDPEATYPLVPYATQVTISLDGLDHDKSRGVSGNLANVMRLLTHLKAMKSNTTLQITFGPWNARSKELAQENIEWFLDTCMSYNAQPRFNIASDDGLLGISRYEQKEEVLTHIRKYLLDLSNKIGYEKISKSLRSGSQYILTAVMKSNGTIFTCNSTSIYSTIGADGSVWMCQGLPEKEAVVGSLMGEDTFDQIWASFADKRKEYRACQACTLSCQLNGDIAYMNAKAQ